MFIILLAPLMARNKTTQLSIKHWKALELIEEGSMKMEDIAKSIGWSRQTLYDLMSGNTAKTGSIGELFYSELRKMHVRNTSKVKHLHKDNQRLSLIKINERLRELNDKKPTEAVTKEICKILNSLGKLGPTVAITNNSINFNHLNPEELKHEFSRLKTLARSALDGTGIQRIEQGGPRELPDFIESGGGVSEE